MNGESYQINTRTVENLKINAYNLFVCNIMHVDTLFNLVLVQHFPFRTPLQIIFMCDMRC